jgi:hypothetical protein
MSSYLIIGCGHFGSRTVLKLLEKDPRARITVVDRYKKQLEKISRLPVETIACDGRPFLEDFLSEGRPVDYIIPAVPYHLAFESILSLLKHLGAKRVEVPPLQGIPNPMRGKAGDLYTSLANFLCPDDCPEPSQFCTITGKKRPRPLFDILADLKGSFDSFVIRSRQLELGVGGFQPKEWIDLIDRIKKQKRSNHLLLISTACRCHGVTSALGF